MKEEEKKESRFFFILKIIRIVVAIGLAVMALVWLTEEKVGLMWNLTINITAWLIAGAEIGYQMLKGIFREKEFFSEATLMTLAAIAAFCLRFFGPDQNNFFDAVILIVLYQIGELLQDIATDKSREAIVNAAALRASVAHRILESGIEDVDPQTLVLGDHIEIRVGETIPADGVVLSGSGAVDLSSLTGESDPQPIEEQGTVYSGTKLVAGSLIVSVSKSYEDSTVSKIIKLIEEGAESKAKGHRFVDKFAKYYTPIVFGVAILLCVIPPLFLGIHEKEVWGQWLFIGISALIIACPCAIVISIPLAYFSSLGAASKRGILIKGANLLDRLAELKTVAMDKTGTLTKGEFSVISVKPVGIERNFLLELASAAESRSNHPLALGIQKEMISFERDAISDYAEVPGKGITLAYQKKPLIIGRQEFIAEHGFDVESATEPGSALYVCYDGSYVGTIVLSDKIKEETKEFVSRLNSYNIQPVLLSGDNGANVAAAASEAGIGEYRGALLPGDKLEEIKRLRDTQGPVAFMGDGINDAPSIALADVGVGMGAMGSDLTIDAADVVIMDDNPEKVADSISIAKRCRRRIIFDIVAALVVKVAVVLMAIFIPNFPLFVAVAADTGLTLILIGITVTLLWQKPRK